MLKYAYDKKRRSNDMSDFLSWLGNLSTGVLASIIAAFICALFVSSAVVRRIRRKSKLYISHSDIGGDVIAGDKGRRKTASRTSVKDSRSTDTFVKKTKVKGDIVQGDKEE